MSKKKQKHDDTVSKVDCDCDVCTMRGESYYHLHDTASSLIMLYTERYEVDSSLAGISVVHGLMDVLADMIVAPAMGMPDEKKLLAEMVEVFRERVEEIRQAKTEEITEAAAEAQAELN